MKASAKDGLWNSMRSERGWQRFTEKYGRPLKDDHAVHFFRSHLHSCKHECTAITAFNARIPGDIDLGPHWQGANVVGRVLES